MFDKRRLDRRQELLTERGPLPFVSRELVRVDFPAAPEGGKARSRCPTAGVARLLPRRRTWRSSQELRLFRLGLACSGEVVPRGDTPGPRQRQVMYNHHQIGPGRHGPVLPAVPRPVQLFLRPDGRQRHRRRRRGDDRSASWSRVSRGDGPLRGAVLDVVQRRPPDDAPRSTTSSGC